MAPYFPFFLYALIVWHARFRFLFFCIISVINISASSQAFFICSLFITILLFRRSIGFRSYVFISASFFVFLAIIVMNWEVVEGVINKIIRLAIDGDETDGGGRSIGVLIKYLYAYPLGIGYSGSTLRTAFGLPEINSGFFAFITQYSLLSPVLLLGYAWLLFRTIRTGLQSWTIGRCMTVGVLVSPIIFFADILWFVPMVWLPFEIILGKLHSENIK